jgi:hypothetical protein
MHGTESGSPSVRRTVHAVRQNISLNTALIHSPGKCLLKRKIVSQLGERHGYDFRATRLIEELRERTGDAQSARYGRGRIPVFQVKGIPGWR